MHINGLHPLTLLATNLFALAGSQPMTDMSPVTFDLFVFYKLGWETLGYERNA